jgi:hypothetical protein
MITPMIYLHESNYVPIFMDDFMMRVQKMICVHFIGFAYQSKDIVFRFIIDYSTLRIMAPM